MAEWLPERHVGLQLGRECKKQAKAFRLNLVEGLIAQQWYNNQVLEEAKDD
jgi:hypothetical protein